MKCEDCGYGWTECGACNVIVDTTSVKRHDKCNEKKIGIVHTLVEKSRKTLSAATTSDEGVTQLAETLKQQCEEAKQFFKDTLALKLAVLKKVSET